MRLNVKFQILSVSNLFKLLIICCIFASCKTKQAVITEQEQTLTSKGTVTVTSKQFEGTFNIAIIYRPQSIDFKVYDDLFVFVQNVKYFNDSVIYNGTFSTGSKKYSPAEIKQIVGFYLKPTILKYLLLNDLSKNYKSDLLFQNELTAEITSDKNRSEAIINDLRSNYLFNINYSDELEIDNKKVPKNITINNYLKNISIQINLETIKGNINLIP